MVTMYDDRRFGGTIASKPLAALGPGSNNLEVEAFVGTRDDGSPFDIDIDTGIGVRACDARAASSFAGARRHVLAKADRFQDELMSLTSLLRTLLACTLLGLTAPAAAVEEGAKARIAIVSSYHRE